MKGCSQQCSHCFDSRVPGFEMTVKLIGLQRHCQSTYLVMRQIQDMQQHSMHLPQHGRILVLLDMSSECINHIALGHT